MAFAQRFFVISYKSSIIILIQISKFAKVCCQLKIQNDKLKMIHEKTKPGFFILFILIIFNGFFLCFSRLEQNQITDIPARAFLQYPRLRRM